MEGALRLNFAKKVKGTLPGRNRRKRVDRLVQNIRAPTELKVFLEDFKKLVSLWLMFSPLALLLQRCTSNF